MSETETLAEKWLRENPDKLPSRADLLAAAVTATKQPDPFDEFTAGLRRVEEQPDALARLEAWLKDSYGRSMDCRWSESSKQWSVILRLKDHRHESAYGTEYAATVHAAIDEAEADE